MIAIDLTKLLLVVVIGCLLKVQRIYEAQSLLLQFCSACSSLVLLLPWCSASVCGDDCKVIYMFEQFMYYVRLNTYMYRFTAVITVHTIKSQHSQECKDPRRQRFCRWLTAENSTKGKTRGLCVARG